MTIDLRWTFPVVLPFGFLALFRALWFMAGAEWSEPSLAAAMAFILGLGGFLVSLGCEPILYTFPSRKDRPHD